MDNPTWYVRMVVLVTNPEYVYVFYIIKISWDGKFINNFLLDIQAGLLLSPIMGRWSVDL